MPIRSLFTLLIFLVAGCAETLSLNSLPTCPSHWQDTPEIGDSIVGHLTSTENYLTIGYDIGDVAGQYAAAKNHPDHQWVKSGRLAGSTFQYLLDKDNTLYITFIDDGPANFWATVKTQSDIDYMIELLARHRDKLVSAWGAG